MTDISKTALTSAAARAAHLIVDSGPVIHRDSLAFDLLGARADELVDYHRRNGDHPVLAGARAAAVVRARYTEDVVAGSGARQYVVLGAGLDSYAHRPGRADGLRVFEVDQTETQAYKRARLAELGLGGDTAFVAVDFETDDVRAALADAGLDRAEPAVISWLGVSMYLTADAIGAVLDLVAGCAPGTELVFDHMLPPSLRDEAGQVYAAAVAAFAAERGEPWRTLLGPEDTAALLRAHGLAAVEHRGQHGAVPAALWRRTDALAPIRLTALTRARVPDRG